jgi:chromosome segregation ATPase
LKLLEDAVAEEKRYRGELFKRLERAELECVDLREKLRRSVDTMERMKAHHDNQISSMLLNLESCEMKCKQQSTELDEVTTNNSQQKGKLEESVMKLNENNKSLKAMELKLKKSSERSQFLECQVALINELFHDNEIQDIPVDLDKIKTILK